MNALIHHSSFSVHRLLLAEAAGVEPAHAMRGDLANRCHTIRRRLRKLPADIAGGSDIMAEGEGVEPSRRIARPGFQDQLRATFQIGWDARI